MGLTKREQQETRVDNERDAGTRERDTKGKGGDGETKQSSIREAFKLAYSPRGSHAHAQESKL